MSFEGHLFLALLEGTVTGFVLALTALGLSLVFGVMRIVNVAHGEFFMLGAVIAWYFSTMPGGFLPALVAAPLLVGGVAFLADRLVLVESSTSRRAPSWRPSGSSTSFSSSC